MAAASSLLSRALDPTVETPTDEASERILNAALELAAGSGVRHLTMDDVAERAGVGRMTVYRRFGGKDELVEALAVRECRRCLAEIEAAIDPEADPGRQIGDGFVAALGVARTHPLLQRLTAVEPQTLLASLGPEPGGMLELMQEFLLGWVKEVRRSGRLRDIDPEAAVELLLRVGVSFVFVPEGRVDFADEKQARRFAEQLIAPAIVTPRRRRR